MAEIKVIEPLYDFLEQARAKTVVLYGGAGAGKSYTLAQFLVEKFLTEKNKHFLISRKTTPSLKLTVYPLILETLNSLGIEYELNKSDKVITRGKNKIFFKGMDDPEKIKSAEFNYAWLEEATEFTPDDYRQVRLRLRRSTGGKTRNQMYLTFNPTDENHWIYETFFRNPIDDIQVFKAVYKDNPFLTEDYIKSLEALINEDESYYKIYVLGEFVALKGMIYSNYTIEKIDEDFDEVIAGLDFGFNNPSALVVIGIKDGIYYVFKELYESKLTNADLIRRVGQMIDKNVPIYADSAEPNRIEEFYRAGFNIYPSDKSVKDGIDFVKRQKLMIDPSCVNTIREIKGYKWRQDKNGNVLDEPVKFHDHTCDALRYAIYTHNKVGEKTIETANIDIF